MDARSQPYFFSFDTKSKPGKIIAHCLRLETVEIDAEGFDDTTFATLDAAAGDKRFLQLVDCVQQK
jgi:hypothetical protein